MRIIDVAFIAYPATDEARARAFYEGVLGLACGMSLHEDGQFWIEYEIGPHTLGIGNEPFLKASKDGPHVVLEVEDFDESVDHLRRHEVPFDVEPFDMPKCRAAIVLDPDGNRVGIHQRKA